MRRVALSCAILAAVVAVPASAQRTFDPERVDKSAIGSRFKLAEVPVEHDKMRVFQKRIAKCAAIGNRKNARELLEKSDPERIDYDELSKEYDVFMEEFGIGRCIGRAMPASARMMRINFSGKTMRNLMAEEIYLYDNKKPIEIGEGEPEQLPNRYYTGGGPYMMAKIPAELADCIVHREPGKAHALLKSTPASKKEKAAAEALYPVVSDCLPGEDDEVSFSLAQLRAYVADGLWSRSHYGKLASGSVTVEGEGSE